LLLISFILYLTHLTYNQSGCFVSLNINIGSHSAARTDTVLKIPSLALLFRVIYWLTSGSGIFAFISLFYIALGVAKYKTSGIIVICLWWLAILLLNSLTWSLLCSKSLRWLSLNSNRLIHVSTTKQQNSSSVCRNFSKCLTFCKNNSLLSSFSLMFFSFNRSTYLL
jgi:hypothetical protein